MSRVLIIKAHPYDVAKSTSIQLLEAFLEEYKKVNADDEIETLDLYKTSVPEIDKEILDMWTVDKNKLSIEKQNKWNEWNQYLDKFLESDKIIIVNPLWNLAFPAPLKNWFDVIIQSEKTFMYTENGLEGLAGGRKVLHLQSNGSKWYGNDLATKFIDDAFAFIGINDVTHIYIDGKDIPGNLEKSISKGIADVKNIAKTF